MKIESLIKTAMAENSFELYSQGAESAAFFTGENKVLSVGRIKTGKFDEALGLAEKLRRHMANDSLSATMDSENVIPFGCEYRVKRHWKFSGNIAEVTDDIHADNGGRITDLSLENIEFHGKAEKVFILFAGADSIQEFPASGVIYDGETLPLLVKVFFAGGSAADVYNGDDFWRHLCACNYAGGKAHHVIEVLEDKVIWERHILNIPEETEVEKRPWRFKTVFAVSRNGEVSGGETSCSFDGCFAAPAKHREFRTFIRQQKAQTDVKLAVTGKISCTDGSHVARSGKEVLHGMIGELFDEYIWGTSAMARKGGSLVICAAIPGAENSVILENMSKAAAELSFTDLEEYAE